MFALIDLALLFGILSLIFYILIITAILPGTLGGLAYIFSIVAIVLVVIWVLLRILGECSGGSYRYRYGRNNQSIV